MNTPSIAPQNNARLFALRQKIDSIDEQLLSLLHARAALSREIGKVKACMTDVIDQPQREEAILHTLCAKNTGILPAPHIHAIWHAIFASSRALQQESATATP